MKTKVHKILSVIMAVMVFISTTSFILDAHFCGDSLVNLAFIQHTDACGMETPQNNSDCDTNITKSSCCSDVQIVNQGQDQVQLTSVDLSIDQQFIVASFIFTYINLFEGLEVNIIPYREYRPPLLIMDIHKLEEVYII